jgi:hypothetical protein
MFINEHGLIAKGAANSSKEKIDNMSNITEIWLGALLPKKQ